MTDYVQKSVLVARYYVLSTAAFPGNPPVGAEIYETDTGVERVWTGTAWIVKTDGAISVSGNVATTVADGASVTLGAKADAAATDSTTTNTLMAFLKGLVGLVSARLGIGANNLASTTVAVDTTVGGTQIVGARALRKSVTIMNLSTTVVYIGTGTITSSQFQLPGVVGAFISLGVTTAVKGLSASGSVNVSVIEEYYS